jgi:predicted metal-dependent peptidase
MNAAVTRKFEQAYTTVILEQPFLTTMLMRLIRIEDPTAPTMWTDGKRLGYNPEFVQSLTQEELIGVLAHEVIHVAALHPFRRQDRQPAGWNLATDAVVNQIVGEMGLTLPKGGVKPVADKSAEELYYPLQEIKMMGAGGAGGSPGQPNNDPGGFGEVRDPTNDDGSAMSRAEQEAAEMETKVNVQQSLNAAKKAGKLPASLARMIDEMMEPRVPWKEILSRFLDQHVKSDYSWTHPNRAYLNMGIVYPSLKQPAYGQVVVGVDTSGSMDYEMLKGACSEVLGCLNTYAARGQSPELTVIWCDTQPHEQVVEDSDELRPVGGGGTAFSPVFRHVEAQGYEPRVIIYITDGYSEDFGPAPDVPVLWILTAPNRSFKPPFGEIAWVMDE